MKQLFLNKFYSTLGDLVSEIKTLFPTQSTDIITHDDLNDLNNLNNLNNESSSYLDNFYKNTKEVSIELSEKNEIVFSKDICLLEGINFYLIWNSEITDENKETLWKYLHTLYLYSDQYIRDINLPEIMKLYKKASKNENLKVDTETKVLFGILDNLCGNKLGITSSNEELENRCNDDNKENHSEKGTLRDLPGLPSLAGLSDMKLPTEGLFNGQIGQLATEIASELDTSTLETENPSEMIQNLLSGNMKDDSPVFKLVHQISDKIQNKLSSGDVDEMKLFEEAKGAMKMMGANNKHSPFNMLHKMTEKMGNLNSSDNKEETDDISKQIEDMLKSSGINTDAINNITSKLNTTQPISTSNGIDDKRRFLKEKLKKKKQLLETKKKLDKLKNNY